MLKAAETALQRCIVLLGINAGFGQHDCAKLEFDDLDLKRGWFDSVRTKVGATPRTAKLWDITVQGINDFVENERPRSSSSRIFAGLNAQQIGYRFGPLPLLARCKRKRMSIYGLRHSFETLAGAANDQQAVDRVAGHKEAGSARHYREDFDRARLEHVADVVREAVGL